MSTQPGLCDIAFEADRMDARRTPARVEVRRRVDAYPELVDALRDVVNHAHDSEGNPVPVPAPILAEVTALLSRLDSNQGNL